MSAHRPFIYWGAVKWVTDCGCGGPIDGTHRSLPAGRPAHGFAACVLWLAVLATGIAHALRSHEVSRTARRVARARQTNSRGRSAGPPSARCWLVVSNVRAARAQGRGAKARAARDVLSSFEESHGWRVVESVKTLSRRLQVYQQ